MQYIKLKRQAEEVDLFSDDEVEEGTQPISHDDYERLIKYLEKKNLPVILPIQITYYAGLRIGETCGLTWQGINLEEQCLTIKRSIRYDGTKHKNVIGTTKRKKVRIVDFGDTLTEILKTARREQLKSRMAVWNCRVHSALFAGQCQRSWKDLKIFTSTSYGTPTPAIYSRMGQLRKMYRNC